MRYFVFAVVLLTWACTRPALNLGSGECKGLDERTCKSTSGCRAGYCSDCSGRGGGSFAGCYDPEIDQAGLPCPAIACVEPCKGLVESACLQRPDCKTDYCSGCKPTEKFFAGCRGPSEAPSPCPAGACLPPCGDSKDLASCDSRSDCHPVFKDPGTCLCAQPGCCMMFSFCAEGAKAKCEGMPQCLAPQPLCEGDYVVAYTNVCYEGCVRKSDCE